MDKIAKLQEFLSAQPDDSFLQHALALEWLKVGKEIEARDLFKKILQHDPAYIGSYYHLGAVLLKLGEKDEAISWYRNGMEAATKAADRHAYSELQAALEELESDE